MTRLVLVSAGLLAFAPALSGCLVLGAADAAGSVAAATVKTGAKVAGAAAGVTVGAARAGTDAVTTTDRERCLRAVRREGFDERLCYETPR